VSNYGKTREKHTLSFPQLWVRW